MSFRPSFEVGSTVTNDVIYKEFGCSNMGGMRPARKKNALLIFSLPHKGLYEDKWDGDVLHYTGMGKIGDQVLDGNQNRTLFESDTNGIAIHLFESLVPTQYIYHGLVKLASAPYQDEQKDENGNLRKVWMFPVKPIEKVVVSGQTFEEYKKEKKKQVKGLTKEQLKARAQEGTKRKASSRTVESKTYVRDPFVSEYVKLCADGICQLCGKPAPFKDKQGKPYLEEHHIVWLAAGGADSIDNTIALCPNCHRKMHVINARADVKILLEKAKKNL